MKSWVRKYSSDRIGIFFSTCRTVHVGLCPRSGSICRCLFPKLFSSSLSHLFSIPITIWFFSFPCLVRSGKSVLFVFPTGSLAFGWFYGVESLAPHPTPNLEDQSIVVSLGSHSWPVWQGRPCQELYYRQHGSQDLLTQVLPQHQSRDTFGCVTIGMAI